MIEKIYEEELPKCCYSNKKIKFLQKMILNSFIKRTFNLNLLTKYY